MGHRLLSHRSRRRIADLEIAILLVILGFIIAGALIAFLV